MAKRNNNNAKPAPAAAKPATAPALPWQGVQNGVQPPKRAGACAAVWQLTTAGITSTPQGLVVPTLATVQAAGAAQGLNPTNVNIEYYRCRQWHGVRGRQAKPASPAA